MHIDATPAEQTQEHMAHWLNEEYPINGFLMRAPDWTPIDLACELWDRDLEEIDNGDNA